MGKIKVLMLTPNLNLLCGRSKSVFNTSISLIERGYEVNIGTNGGDNINKFTNNNIKIFILKNYSEGINIFKLFKSIIELRKIISEYSFNIVHSHHRFYELVVNIINLLFYRNILQTVFTAHNIYLNRRPFQFTSNKIIAVSNFVKDNLVKKQKVNENKVTVIYNFLLKEEIIYLKSNYSSKGKDNIIIITSGRFQSNRNLMVLLESLKLLIDEKTSLLIVGEGYHEENYKTLISHNNLNVKYIKPTIHFFDLLMNSDISVLTSINEGMSYFVLESIYANKYIIAPYTGGHVELLNKYSKYLLFDHSSSKDLADKIKTSVRFYLDGSKDYSFNDPINESHCIDLLLKTYNYSKQFSNINNN